MEAGRARMTETKNIYFRLPEFLSRDSRACLAVLLRTSGSTPQVAGSAALFGTRGLVLGTIGGGILEAEVERQALRSLRAKDRRPHLREFRLEGDFAEKNGAVCGGSAEVLIDPAVRESASVFCQVRRSLLGREPGILLTVIGDPSFPAARVKRRWLRMKDLGQFGTLKRYGYEEEIRLAADQDSPGLFQLGRGRRRRFLFVEPLFPLSRLIIAGAGHVGRAVAHLGSLLDFEVAVIDDRPEYANWERFPEADRILVGDIGKTLSGLPLGPDSFVVIVTRGHSRDAEALRSSVGREAAYIGVIGSRRKVRLMRREFLAKGWVSPEELEMVHSPIGLKIGSKTVEEIAVSIAAELVLVRNRKPGMIRTGRGIPPAGF